MAAPEFLINPAGRDAPTFVFAHGAGIGMDAPFMTTVAEGLAARGVQVARFEFAYMAQRRTGGAKRPPPKVALLQEEYLAALATLAESGPVVIGGKSMGGRVASLIADDLLAAGKIKGALCLGYPFHPQGKPESLRVAHLEALLTPTLICHGTRDPFGTQEEVATYALSKQVELAWFEDGDHDLKPRKRVTGLDHAAHLERLCKVAADWIKQVCAHELADARDMLRGRCVATQCADWRSANASSRVSQNPPFQANVSGAHDGSRDRKPR